MDNIAAVSDNTSTLTKEAFGEALASALMNERVVDSLYKTLMPFIDAAIKEAVGIAVADVVTKLDHSEAELTQLRRRINDLEAYSRVDNIIVCGLPEEAAEVVIGAQYSADNVPTSGGETSATSEKLFLAFCRNKLNVDVSPNDISVAHRLTRQRTNINGPHPMIVRFSNRKAKLQVLAARKLLRNQPSCKNIFINEHLTAGVSQLFQKARSMVKAHRIKSAWTAGGKLLVRTLPSNGDRTLTILCETDLANL